MKSLTRRHRLPRGYTCPRSNRKRNVPVHVTPPSQLDESLFRTDQKTGSHHAKCEFEINKISFHYKMLYRNDTIPISDDYVVKTNCIAWKQSAHCGQVKKMWEVAAYIVTDARRGKNTYSQPPMYELVHKQNKCYNWCNSRLR